MPSTMDRASLKGIQHGSKARERPDLGATKADPSIDNYPSRGADHHNFPWSCSHKVSNESLTITHVNHSTDKVSMERISMKQLLKDY